MRARCHSWHRRKTRRSFEIVFFPWLVYGSDVRQLRFSVSYQSGFQTHKFGIKVSPMKGRKTSIHTNGKGRKASHKISMTYLNRLFLKAQAFDSVRYCAVFYEKLSHVITTNFPHPLLLNRMNQFHVSAIIKKHFSVPKRPR